jgi:hypothetical protein
MSLPYLNQEVKRTRQFLLGLQQRVQAPGPLPPSEWQGKGVVCTSA